MTSLAIATTSGARSLRELADRLGARLVLAHKQVDPQVVLADVEAAVAEDPWDRALRYVVRMEDFSSSLEAARAFGLACDRAVSCVLSGGELSGIDDALGRLAEERRRAAGADGKADDFGRPRHEAPDDLSPRTPLLSRNLTRGVTLACRYTPYLERALRVLAQPDAEADGSRHVARGLTPAGPLELTHTLWARTPLKEDLEWAHPSSDAFAPILAHCDETFRSALVAPRRDALRLVAELHWWLAHLNRYRRGSGSIADMLTKLVLAARGISVPAWRSGIAPDLEAFVTPLDSYRASYAALFERPPEGVA